MAGDELMWPVETQSEGRFTRPSDWCPKPERWNSTDSDSTEVEVSKLVGAFTLALQPDVVIETGSAWGQTAEQIGKALVEAGQGHLITMEVNQERADATAKRCEGLPVQIAKQSSLVGLDTLIRHKQKVDFAWLDSLFELRVAELQRMEELISPAGIVGIHDTAPHHPLERMLREDAVYERWDVINLPTPRGVMFLQLRRD